MKNIILIITIILLCLLLLADIFYPIILAVWYNNPLLLFLYFVWILPIGMGFAIVGGAVRIILEFLD